MSYSYEFPHPAVSVDACVFRCSVAGYELLLIRRKADPYPDCWALPGGFVEIDEDLDDAIARELAEETGLDGIALEQLHTFGAVNRDPRERVISVAYAALVDPDEIDTNRIRGGDDAADAAWFPLEALPELAFDHDRVVAKAIAKLGLSRPEPGN